MYSITLPRNRREWLKAAGGLTAAAAVFAACSSEATKPEGFTLSYPWIPGERDGLYDGKLNSADGACVTAEGSLAVLDKGTFVKVDELPANTYLSPKHLIRALTLEELKTLQQEKFPNSKPEQLFAAEVEHPETGTQGVSVGAIEDFVYLAAPNQQNPNDPCYRKDTQTFSNGEIDLRGTPPRVPN